MTTLPTNRNRKDEMKFIKAYLKVFSIALLIVLAFLAVLSLLLWAIDEYDWKAMLAIFIIIIGIFSFFITEDNMKL